MDLVFRDGADAELFWVGPMTRAEIITLNAPARFLGVRFRPGAAPAFVGLDARDLLDRDVPANDARLLDALVNASCETARRALLLAALARQRAAVPDPVVVGAAAAILDAAARCAWPIWRTAPACRSAPCTVASWQASATARSGSAGLGVAPSLRVCNALVASTAKSIAGLRARKVAAAAS